MCSICFSIQCRSSDCFCLFVFSLTNETSCDSFACHEFEEFFVLYKYCIASTLIFNGVLVSGSSCVHGPRFSYHMNYITLWGSFQMKVPKIVFFFFLSFLVSFFGFIYLLIVIFCKIVCQGWINNCQIATYFVRRLILPCCLKKVFA